MHTTGDGLSWMVEQVVVKSAGNDKAAVFHCNCSLGPGSSGAQEFFIAPGAIQLP